MPSLFISQELFWKRKGQSHGSKLGKEHRNQIKINSCKSFFFHRQTHRHSIFVLNDSNISSSFYSSWPWQTPAKLKHEKGSVCVSVFFSISVHSTFFSNVHQKAFVTDTKAKSCFLQAWAKTIRPNAPTQCSDQLQLVTICWDNPSNNTPTWRTHMHIEDGQGLSTEGTGGSGAQACRTRLNIQKKSTPTLVFFHWSIL